MVTVESKITDTIPRASVAQILGALCQLAAVQRSTFDATRRFLYSLSGRRVPPSDSVLWTVARDVLTELQRLELATVGALPRRRSDIDRFRESPSEITPAGKELAQLTASKPGQAYDVLLIAWMNLHPYFRSLNTRVRSTPLYVPDVTNATQLGDSRLPNDLGSHVLRNCLDRMAKIGFGSESATMFERSLRRRMSAISPTLASPDLDSKKLVDLVQDSVVIPSFLEAERLPFDGVTFQHLLRIVAEFFAAASTTSHPNFDGRIVFSTCDFSPNVGNEPSTRILAVQHHGISFARPKFADALTNAYLRIAGSTGGYVDAYMLRAIVCVELRIQPPVFSAGLKDIIASGDIADPTIYTELPFTPPPQGEAYVEVGGRRIGKLKISSARGA